jgi:hypothetical protein
LEQLFATLLLRPDTRLRKETSIMGDGYFPM